MSSLRARYHTKYDVALFSLQTVRPVPALMRFSAPHWLGSFSIVLPRSGLRGFVPVVRDRREQGPPARREQGPPAAGGRGPERGGDTMGGGCGGPGPESIYTTSMELGPKDHPCKGLEDPVPKVYMSPLGKEPREHSLLALRSMSVIEQGKRPRFPRRDQKETVYYSRAWYSNLGKSSTMYWLLP